MLVFGRVVFLLFLVAAPAFGFLPMISQLLAGSGIIAPRDSAAAGEEGPRPWNARQTATRIDHV
ncbi:hypothetical protein PRIPAC_86951 [Pristionchus pacificus]|uniref:Uncharacterized protein n=1 Tax=Pristionchus pacificus TaxID=54126 RepID=A0A454Y3L9_PRIPA|nr:hypothetical protein PRIPAC_86951 [Pristionchus pacificus]|eukprot:PDM67482.1 hypothetical protein PRIPAC_48899 [Pristionchus pacificus]